MARLPPLRGDSLPLPERGEEGEGSGEDSRPGEESPIESLRVRPFLLRDDLGVRRLVSDSLSVTSKADEGEAGGESSFRLEENLERFFLAETIVASPPSSAAFMGSSPSTEVAEERGREGAEAVNGWSVSEFSVFGADEANELVVAVETFADLGDVDLTAESLARGEVAPERGVLASGDNSSRWRSSSGNMVSKFSTMRL